MASNHPNRTYVLHVCTSCRADGGPREPYERRSGYKLYQALKAALSDSEVAESVTLRAAECLSVCPRPCGIAISSPGSWSYLFGDQQSSASVQEIIDCLTLYVSRTKGFMSRNERPAGLRGSILGRIPPYGGPRASL